MLTIVTAAVLLAYSVGDASIVISTATVELSRAISMAAPSDTIFVKSGRYEANRIVIDKKITLIGESLPVIDGMGKGTVIWIKSDSVTIRGFKIVNSGDSYLEDRAGIEIDSVSDCVIEANQFDNNCFAIYLSGASDCLVKDNRIISYGQSQTIAGNGIHLWNSRNIIIEGNEIIGHRDGIYLEFARHCLITGNKTENNLRYGLHFMFSDSCRYETNRFVNNGAGVAVMYSQSVVMDNNRFLQNRGDASYGLLLKEISGSKIERNIFAENTVGIYSENVNRTLIKNNVFEKNGWAIRVMANCTDIDFLGNDFNGNSFEVTTNGRGNFSRFSKNYWSGYKGYDLNRDGIGDIPYRPVRLFAYIVEKFPFAIILLHSPFVEIIDMAEALAPSLTPTSIVDSEPLLRPLHVSHK